MAERPLVSIAIPCLNEAAALLSLYQEIASAIEPLEAEYRFRVFFIDDGSTDNTWQRVRELADRDGRVGGVSFTANRGHQKALICAYDHLPGDAIVTLDADGQDPPGLIAAMLSEWRRGSDIVVATHSTREGETAFKRVTAVAYYRLFVALTGIKAPLDGGDFRLMSRAAIERFASVPRRHHYVRGAVATLGLPTATVSFHRRGRSAGEGKYSVRRMLRFGADGLRRFGAVRMRRVAVASFLGSVFTVFGAWAAWIAGVSPLFAIFASAQAALFVALFLASAFLSISVPEKPGPLYEIRETIGVVADEPPAGSGRFSTPS